MKLRINLVAQFIFSFQSELRVLRMTRSNISSRIKRFVDIKYFCIAAYKNNSSCIILIHLTFKNLLCNHQHIFGLIMDYKFKIPFRNQFAGRCEQRHLNYMIILCKLAYDDSLSSHVTRSSQASKPCNCPKHRHIIKASEEHASRSLSS